MVNSYTKPSAPLGIARYILERERERGEQDKGKEGRKKKYKLSPIFFVEEDHEV